MFVEAGLYLERALDDNAGLRIETERPFGEIVRRVLRPGRHAYDRERLMPADYLQRLGVRVWVSAMPGEETDGYGPPAWRYVEFGAVALMALERPGDRPQPRLREGGGQATCQRRRRGHERWPRATAPESVRRELEPLGTEFPGIADASDPPLPHDPFEAYEIAAAARARSPADARLMLVSVAAPPTTPEQLLRLAAEHLAVMSWSVGEAEGALRRRARSLESGAGSADDDYITPQCWVGVEFGEP